MFRPWQTAVAFTLCLAVVLTALAWVSVTVLRLEREQAAAQEQAALEENVRLALWRMDSAVAPLLARENMRPISDFNTLDLAWQQVPDVLLYCQISPSGKLTSPQVPRADSPQVVAGTAAAAKSEAVARLGCLQEICDPVELLAKLPQGGTTASPAVFAPDNFFDVKGDNVRGINSRMGGRNAEAAQQSQQAKNTGEYFARAQLSLRNNDLNSKQANGSTAPAAIENAVIGVMTPLWRSGELLLMRRVTQGDKTYMQGCWLDWPAMRASLLDNVRDLLPQAELEPAPLPIADDQSRLMAALPVRLTPGSIDWLPSQDASPLGLSLGMAWACVLLAVAAVAVLLLGVVALSERRSAFVSAVTHELRTPLTTFRMYAEMLADGMVTDPESRHQYLDTLRIEAGRLTHLVENVLSYARLERGSARGQMKVVSVTELLPRIESRLRDRAAFAGMDLVVDTKALASIDRVRTDMAAVEQILFNLLDNACKYAASATDRRVHLQVESQPKHVLLRVRDHGPGVSEQARRRLFRPFSKSVVEAAHSAPGVGLGLALSRRMARAMGGELRLEAGDVASPGACFALVLPKADC